MSPRTCATSISAAPRIMVVDGSKLVRKLIGDVLVREVADVEVIGLRQLAEARAALASRRRSTW